MMMRLRPGRPAAAVKHACRECESRRALFRYRGIVKWDRYHTLCFQCYRKHVDRTRTAIAAMPWFDLSPVAARPSARAIA
ncbi:MAG: hypothetical protein FJW29_05290 [Acidobacteria bacterium]|nr:hypothetical protein [Acidobacteriota bacterium]